MSSQAWTHCIRSAPGISTDLSLSLIHIFKDYLFADTFEEAVLTAAKIAMPGDAVLLSPACASWDMFPSYEVRGEKFKEIVNSL